MPRTLPPLAYLRAFEAVARLGSVTRAADELGRTHGAVSKQLHLLQDEAGVSLFEKQGTGLRLTRPGQLLHAAVEEAFDRLDAGYGAIRRDRSIPRVHVACSATFAMAWLVPHLGDFYLREPDCQVQLSMASPDRGLDRGLGRDLDVTLSFNRLSNPAVERGALALASVTFLLVCRPGYPLVIENGTCWVPVRIVHEHVSAEWETWQRLSGHAVIASTERSFPHTHLAISAAVAGLGVALVERRLVEGELAAGRLVAPLGGLDVTDGFVAITGRHPAPATTRFLDWLAGALRH